MPINLVVGIKTNKEHVMQSDVNFYPGQLVILRSGGPLMTVNSILNNGEIIQCNWFDLNLRPEVCCEEFYASVLKPHGGQSLKPDGKVVLSEGDVVLLRSGGPAMTVLYVKDNEYHREAGCIWFDEQNRKASSSSTQFHPNALVIKF